MGDNDKATFGAGDDLQIYHDGANSVVKETGSGQLRLQGDDLYLMDAAGTSLYLAGVSGAQTQIYHNAATKLATTATGIDVTGRAVVDGLTSSASIVGTSNSNSLGGTTFTSAISTVGLSSTAAITSTSNSNSLGGTSFTSSIDVTGTVTADGLDISSTGNDSFTQTHTDGNTVIFTQSGTGGDVQWRNANGGALINTAATNRALFASNGDVSFYEDTGTTAKFFWDASAEKLGIGTSSPDTVLHLAKSSAATLRLESTATALATGGVLGAIEFESNDTGSQSGVNAKINSVFTNTVGATSLQFFTSDSFAVVDSTPKMVINNVGNVGIGTDSPSEKLHIQGDGADILLTDAAGGQTAKLGATGSNNGLLELNNSAHVGTVFLNSSGDSYLNGGNVGIGTDSPATLIEASGSSTSTTTGISSPLGLTLRNTDTTDGNYTTIQNRDGNGDQNAEIKFINVSHAGNTGAIAFTTRSATGEFAEKVRISHTGSVGIGTSSPARPLHVSTINSVPLQLNHTDGTDVWTKFEHTGGNYYIGYSGTDFVLSPDTAARHLTVNSSGNVGIGTSSPSAVCDIVGSPVATGDARYELIVDENQSLSTGRGGGLAFARQGVIYGGIKTITSGASDDDTDMHFQTRLAGTVANKMVIKSSGNVGIGTSSPANQLHLHNTAGDSFIRMSGGGSLGTNYGGFVRGFGVSGSGGNLDLGVIDNNAFRTSINVQAQGNEVRFSTAGTERMRIDNSGHAIIPAGVTLGTATGVYNAANTLDDYEEGTWTPTAATIGVAGNLGARYTKIGNLVTLTCQIIFGASASTDGILLGGLPFAAISSQAPSSSGVMHSGVTLTGGRTSLHAYITNSQSTLNFYESGSGLAYQSMTINNMSNSSIVLNIQYMTDS